MSSFMDVVDAEWTDGALNLFRVPEEGDDGEKLSTVARVALCARERLYLLHVLKNTVQSLQQVRNNLIIANRHDAFCDLAMEEISGVIDYIEKTVRESEKTE